VYEPRMLISFENRQRYTTILNDTSTDPKVVAAVWRRSGC
jgi:hypothetical protein